MLGKLFGSNARVKILKLFLLNPNHKYYIRQLSRDLKLQLNSVRRELDNLEQFGLLISNIGLSDETENLEVDSVSQKSKKRKKNPGSKQEKKYYQVNTNFILYEEVKSLIVKAQILYEKDFLNKLARIGNPKLIILAGLFMNIPDSPIDILIVGRVNKSRFLKLIKELEKELGKELNFTLMDTREFKYRRDITDVFLYDILEGRNIVVVDEIGLS